MSELARNLYGLARAALRLAECKLSGHQPDPEVPSPPGYYFCSRCRERYPLPERRG